MLLLGMYPYVGRNTINAVALNELSKCFLFFLLLFLHYFFAVLPLPTFYRSQSRMIGTLLGSRKGGFSQRQTWGLP